jgi:hypothetical protein
MKVEGSFTQWLFGNFFHAVAFWELFSRGGFLGTFFTRWLFGNFFHAVAFWELFYGA